MIRRGRKESPEHVLAANDVPAVSVGYEATQCQQYHRAFPDETRIAGGARTKESASPDGEFISGVADKNGTREKGIFENEQVRVSTTFIPKGTDWSAPHDGRDRIVVLLDQINPLAQTNEADSSSSAWRVTRIPANSDIKVPNNSGQTKILMILEFKRHGS